MSDSMLREVGIHQKCDDLESTYFQGAWRQERMCILWVCFFSSILTVGK